MTSEARINVGCGERFAELCALATAGALTPEEWQGLEIHVLCCASCARLAADYRSLTSAGIAKVAAVRLRESGDEQPQWDRSQAKLRFIAALENEEVSSPEEPSAAIHQIRQIVSRLRLEWRVPQLAMAVATCCLIAVALFAGYKLGLQNGIVRGSAIRAFINDTSLADLHSQMAVERTNLNQELAAKTLKIGELGERAIKAESDLKRAQGALASLEARTGALLQQNTTQADSIAALTQEKQRLIQQIAEREAIVRSTGQELDSIRDDRQRLLLRSASLESQVDQLNAQLREHQQSSERTQQYLASDRDIRELMGARQLYIADVFDVDSDGRTKRPFGRVFYTKGKSLIFYAFDLDHQPGYREAKAFQAWGRPSPTQSAPISLGIFYLDNEANRRWALRFDDPKILDEISSVFVTVEPKGGSRKPTNKPFLVAYLHTAPVNHP